jgi:hypothetical protein
VAYTFQAGNKINLLMEYESVIQNALFVESVLKSCKKILQRTLLEWRASSVYLVVSGLKITGHRNPDSNLESLCISFQMQKRY